MNALILEGMRHWGHDVKYPNLVDALLAEGSVTPEYLDESEVWVVVDGAEVVAFYALEDHDDFVELKYMFMEQTRIGTGLGRIMWRHMIVQASEAGERVKIVSDPKAKGFYEAMGAKLESEFEPAPGFSLGIMWFDL